MKRAYYCSWLTAVLVSLFTALTATMPAQVGIFQDHRDIGTILHPGDAKFDAASQTYTVSGSGDNMWFGADDLHFVWKKISGDLAFTADIQFVGAKGNNHRKAALLLRQTLEANSVYADVAVHGDGLTSLQYRDAPGADTHEVETAVSAPQRVRIVKRGSYAYVFVGDKSGHLSFSGAAMRLDLAGDFYVGLGVCAHDKSVTETAVFSHVIIEPLDASTSNPVLWSTLETVKVASTDRLVAYTALGRFEAPNWSADGSSLLINQDGTLQHFTFGSMQPPAPLATGSAMHLNNGYGHSPDGTLLAVSGQNASDGTSHVYVLPANGGTPREVTPTGPSYFHGWSPDGKTLVFTRQRADGFAIYTIPVTDGHETRLTTTQGLNDGPEYSPDSTHIYFSSDRTGTMQIWRMNLDGSHPEQVLTEALEDWLPHLSPDGKWMVYLACKSTASGRSGSFPADKDVELRLMSLPDKKVKVLAKLLGGKGTIDAASWSPDSTRVAFVSYAQLVQ